MLGAPPPLLGNCSGKFQNRGLGTLPYDGSQVPRTTQALLLGLASVPRRDMGPPEDSGSARLPGDTPKQSHSASKAHFDPRCSLGGLTLGPLAFSQQSCRVTRGEGIPRPRSVWVSGLSKATAYQLCDPRQGPLLRRLDNSATWGCGLCRLRWGAVNPSPTQINH